MTTTTQRDNTLDLTLDGLSVQCQVVNLTYTQPSAGKSTTTRTACGGSVSEPGAEPVDGAIAGQVFADRTADGVTTLLARSVDARRDGPGDGSMDFVLTYNPDDPDARTVYAGRCYVDPFGHAFTPGAFGRHDLSLVVTAQDSATYPTG